jgi:hypothetical protein
VTCVRTVHHRTLKPLITPERAVDQEKSVAQECFMI